MNLEAITWAFRCEPTADVCYGLKSRDDLRTKSPPAVSTNGNIRGRGQRFFGDFHFKIGETGVQRQNRMREKPEFPRHSRVSWRAWSNARMSGWRRSAHRTRLYLNSLQTGNFTGKITISGLKATISKQETTVPQRFFKKFPKQTIRELFQTNREF